MKLHRIKFLIIATVFICSFLFMVGCFAPNMQGPCCTINKSTAQCQLHAPADSNARIAPEPETCDGSILSNNLKCTTNWCAIAEPSENETIYVKYDSINGRKILNCTNVSLNNMSEPCNHIGYCYITFENMSASCTKDADCPLGTCINTHCTGYAFYPTCSSRPELDFDTNCKTMLCGNIQYSPKQSLLPEYGKNLLYQNVKTTATQALYNAMCNFYTLDANTMKKLKKAKDVFVNTFRIGFGNSIQDYEEARFYFPLSDKFCSASGNPNLKDRYMNYLNITNSPYSSFDPSTLTNRSTALGCDVNNPEFPPAVNGNYFFTTFTESSIPATYIMPDTQKYKYALYSAYWDEIYKTKWTCSLDKNNYSSVSSCELACKTNQVNPCTGTIPIRVNYDSCNGACSPSECQIGNLNSATCSKYYINYANGVYADCGWNNGRCEDYYEDQAIYCNPILLGNCMHSDFITNADFECNSSSECISGLCSKEDNGYERGFCVRSDTKTSANCLCYEMGRRLLSGNEVRCEAIKNSNTYTPLTTNICAINNAPYLDCNETMNAPQIIFFNQTTDGYIGYAIMNESEFQSSMLATTCGPFTKGIDYDVYTPPSVEYDITTNWEMRACINSYSETYVEDVEGGWWWHDYITRDICDKTYASLILIKTHSNCFTDDGIIGPKAPGFPKLNTVFGWCEPCTSATMVSVDLDAYYPAFRNYYFGCPSPNDNANGCGVAVGLGGSCGALVKNYMNSLANVRTRVDNYLKAGVIPIIWYANGELGTTWTYSGGYQQVCGNCNGKQAGETQNMMLQTLRNKPAAFLYSPDNTQFFEQFGAHCYDRSECRGHDDDCNGPWEGKSTYSAPSGETYIGERIEAKNKISLKCWHDDNYYTNCYWWAGYHFLKNAIGNSASIVVIASSTDGKNPDTIGGRAKQLKTENCPNCLAAIYVPKMNITRLDEIFGCSDQYNCKIKGNNAWKNVDIILYDDRMNDYMGVDRNLAILEGMTNKSRQFLVRYSKPSIPLISIDDNYLLWDLYNDTFDAMKYLLKNQSILLNSGMISLYFKNWFGLSTNTSSLVTQIGTNRLSTAKDGKFCAIERTLNNYIYSNIIKTVYNKILAINASEAKCVKCTSADYLLNTCNRTCENGIECELPIDMNPANARCQGATAINPCTLCNDSTYLNRNITCNYTYPEGNVIERNYTYNDFSTINTFDMYADIVSSLPKKDKCCMTEGNKTQYNYTYIKISGEGMLTNPIRFPVWGNETVDCSMHADTSSFCNITLPIKDYKIDCAVQK